MLYLQNKYRDVTIFRVSDIEWSLSNYRKISKRSENEKICVPMNFKCILKYLQYSPERCEVFKTSQTISVNLVTLYVLSLFAGSQLLSFLFVKHKSNFAKLVDTS